MCKHPLKAFQIGWNEETGKPKYKIVSYKTDHLEQVRNSIDVCEGAFVSPYAKKVYREWIEIPCGKCIDCRLQYSRMWADRCVYESLYHDEETNWFITLTYDEEHIVDVNSEIFAGTLVKEHFQKFMKRLREDQDRYENNNRIRFFGCGEYGSKTFRPHYHVIIFGLVLRPATLGLWIPSRSGKQQWRCSYLEKLWKNGLVTVSPMSWDTAAYTARYTLKKAYKEYSKELYIKNGLEPEFILMSRRPGIGAAYYEDHKNDIYKFDEIIQRSPDGGRKAKPPKYFDNRLQVENPVLYNEIKQRRKECAEHAKIAKLKRTDKTYEELLAVEEQAMMSRLKALKRDLE